MSLRKRSNSKEKSKLHSRSKHRGSYDFKQLISSLPSLKTFVKLNPYGDFSINFFDPEAVKTLNKALLAHHYGIINWDIPQGYLCPPIPGRAEYIHHIADLIGKLKVTTCLDIGTGSNCIYPIIGATQYNWNFIGSDIDSLAIKNAKQIVQSNTNLKNKIDLRLQHNAQNFFKGVLKPNEQIDIAICNPPFHSSRKEAEYGTKRKLQNLKRKKHVTPILNFGGQSNELWCKGGEATFVSNMIEQSQEFASQCNWFSTLISKSSNLN